MNDNFFKLIEPFLIEYLEKIYNLNTEYKQNIEKESAIFGHLQKNLSDEQKKELDNYYAALCSTMSICQKLAYRQGMRDLAKILLFDEWESISLLFLRNTDILQFKPLYLSCKFHKIYSNRKTKQAAIFQSH